VIKKLGVLVLFVLSLNFLAVAGGVGYLIGTGKLDKEKGKEIAKILFPEPVPTTQPTTQPSDSDPDDPLLSIDELLVKTTGMSAAQQNEFLRSTFESMSAQLDRQRREVMDLRRQVDFAQVQLAKDRATLDQRHQELNTRDQQQTAAATDKGFQESLAVYDAMKAKQVKDIFVSLEEETVVRYLQAMDPRRVSSILKEFKTPEELSKAQSLLEQMRKNGVTPDAMESQRASGSQDAADTSIAQ
jgi:hypothetical protein